MIVRLIRTGGIAGLKVRAEVDSEQLPLAQKRELKKLVEETKLFDQPERPGGRAMPDQFQYEITIEDDGKSHSFVTNDGAASDELLELVDWLTTTSRDQKGGKS
ncbi:MAG: protealysin inhibitor emfourin [Blastocatellia bacterium]